MTQAVNLDRNYNLSQLYNSVVKEIISFPIFYSFMLALCVFIINASISLNVPFIAHDGINSWMGGFDKNYRVGYEQRGIYWLWSTTLNALTKKNIFLNPSVLLAISFIIYFICGLLIVNLFNYFNVAYSSVIKFLILIVACLNPFHYEIILHYTDLLVVNAFSMLFLLISSNLLLYNIKTNKIKIYIVYFIMSTAFSTLVYTANIFIGFYLASLYFVYMAVHNFSIKPMVKSILWLGLIFILIVLAVLCFNALITLPVMNIGNAEWRKITGGMHKKIHAIQYLLHIIPLFIYIVSVNIALIMLCFYKRLSLMLIIILILLLNILSSFTFVLFFNLGGTINAYYTAFPVTIFSFLSALLMINKLVKFKYNNYISVILLIYGCLIINSYFEYIRLHQVQLNTQSVFDDLKHQKYKMCENKKINCKVVVYVNGMNGEYYNHIRPWSIRQQLKYNNIPFDIVFDNPLAENFINYTNLAVKNKILDHINSEDSSKANYFLVKDKDRINYFIYIIE